MIARKYLYLIALAREKHFGRAAVSCHVSPSTLSAAIRDIETELGVAVVERGQQFQGLTPEGRCVVEYAERIAASVTGLKQALACLQDRLSGRLRIGVIPTALTAVAALSAAVARRHPMVRLQIVSLATGDILGQLRHYELDAGVVYLRSADEADLDVVRVWQEEHVLLTATGALEGRDEISWREAAGLNLCLLTPDMQNRRTIDETFAALGCAPLPSLETNSIISLLAHVCSGGWSSIVPRSVLEMIGTPQGVTVLPLVEPSLNWATGVVTLKRDPPSPLVSAVRAIAAGLTSTFGNGE
jgi:DNA-binding transcriptional LysR family regulator